MLAVLLLLIWVALTLGIFYAHYRWRRTHRSLSAAGLHHGGTARPQASEATEDDACGSHGGLCCGLHEVCEKGLPRVAEDLYYDDEELDRFNGRGADDYTAQEEAEWREVLVTLLPGERRSWARCIARRGLKMPRSVMGELVTMITNTPNSAE